MTNSIRFFEESEKISLEEFGHFFESAKNSAFRLEILQEFDVEFEYEAYHNYIDKGIKPDNSFNSDWRNTLSKASKRGCLFERVRLINEPITDYLKFEIACGYPLNIESGENIKCIFTNHMSETFENSVPIFKDFWLFDDLVCFIMEYDLFGRFLGVSMLGDKLVEPYIQLKNEALSKSEDITNTSLWENLT